MICESEVNVTSMLLDYRHLSKFLFSRAGSLYPEPKARGPLVKVTVWKDAGILLDKPLGNEITANVIR